MSHPPEDEQETYFKQIPDEEIKLLLELTRQDDTLVYSEMVIENSKVIVNYVARFGACAISRVLRQLPNR
ncbi:hypothetical protein ACP26L_20045 [Paenibacillus sp. S-38]|uniref:hypothetical protein n=1 Tax=Paenibacillus sp. S-38 TaxID=3416710 RepID=UPI003CF350BE